VGNGICVNLNKKDFDSLKNFRCEFLKIKDLNSLTALQKIRENLPAGRFV